jgi:translation initiation factor IF-2
MRVHELAKELDISSKDLIPLLHHMGSEVKNHMGVVTEEQIKKLRSQDIGFTPDPNDPAALPPETATPAQADSEPPAVAPEPPKEEEPEPEPTPDEVAEEPAEEVAEEEKEDDSKEIMLKGQTPVKDFAEMVGLKPNQLIAELMGMNIFASITQNIDFKVAQKIGDNHGYTVVSERKKKQSEHKPPPKVEKAPAPEPDKPADLETRPPIVVFMGHVDHGKTSLLDKIRQAKVAEGESGGITQHIGAYTVGPPGSQVTFIDTPGHAAFTAMRARGANITDIAVIVVSADEGLKPQTMEAIKHAQAAEVELVVAINKIDLPNANVDRVKQQLQAEGLAPEDWGGTTICCEVSAKTGDGIKELLEMLALQAEVLELTANRNKKARGYVIEAQLEPGMGPTATLLVQSRILKLGDPVVCGTHWGRVKALMDSEGKKVKSAGPSIAVKVMGLDDVPSAGSEFVVYSNDKAARNEAEQRTVDAREETLGESTRAVTLEDLFSATAATEVKVLPIILKSDVQGTLEAVTQALKNIKSDKAQAKFLLTGVGNVTVNDVLLASASKAIIFAFNVGKENQVNSALKREGVELRNYTIIYEVIDDVTLALTGLLDPELRENVLGRAQVKALFGLSKKAKAAGCLVVSGRIFSRSNARVLRDGQKIFEGKLSSLKRFQNDSAAVRDGQECGIQLDRFTAFEEGDIIECYEVESIAQQL